MLESGDFELRMNIVHALLVHLGKPVYVLLMPLLLAFIWVRDSAQNTKIKYSTYNSLLCALSKDEVLEHAVETC